MRKIIFVLIILLGACAPTMQDTRPQVALLNGPTENRVKGLADDLQAELESRPDTPYGLVRSFPLRFLETHRDMYGSRAPRQAASITRSRGADYAALVGLEGKRSVSGERISGDSVEFDVLVSGQLEASIIDAASADTLGSLTSPAFEFRKEVSLPLPTGVTALNPEVRRLINREADKVTLSALELQNRSGALLESFAAELDELLARTVN